MIKIELLDRDGVIRTGKNPNGDEPLEMCAQSEDMVYIASRALCYELGDFVRITTSEKGRYLVVKLDETLDSSLIYLRGNVWEYVIPLEPHLRKAIPDIAFMGKALNVWTRYAKDYEIGQYRNLALNPHDQKDDTGAYPHASANVETRNDSTFFAKNAIDGCYANYDHGPYPFQSWGINRDPNAALRIDFGRKVRVDGVGFVLRADFPHDSYWTEVSLRFDDGTSHTFETLKKAGIQSFSIPEIVTEYVVFEKLIKADDESPFPALTQIEVYGSECCG